MAFEIEQTHQRVRFADAQVVAGEDAQVSSAGEQVLQVFEDSVETALQHEADDDVGAVGGGQFRDDVRQERVVAARDQTLGRGIGVSREQSDNCPVPGMTWRTPPRGSGTSPVYRGMTWTWRCGIVCPAAAPTLTPMLKPSGECVRRIDFPRDSDALGQRRALGRRRVEPARDVTTRHDQRVSVRDGEGVPDAEHQLRLEEHSTRIRSAERTGRVGHR